MSEKIKQPDIQQEMDKVGGFMDALETAKEYGLTAEFVVFFARAIRRGETINEATYEAMREWDL